jgi:hypothetical protein
MSQSALYSEREARKANLTLARLGLPSWDKADVEALQAKVKAKPVDGWFGQKSIKAWKTWARKHASETVADVTVSGGTLAGMFILNGKGIAPPPGVKVVNHLEKHGAPAQLNDTSKRMVPPTQLVLHRGTELHGKTETYAHKTERVLDAKGCSTVFTMNEDGVIYQHFDPGPRRGRHCIHHNKQSDSLDIGGPFSQKRKPLPGQKKITLKMAIGRKGDGKPPLSRRYGTVKCWTMPPEQQEALAEFLPWWCELRGIPLTACEDWRTFRLGGHGTKDPVTDVEGIVAHAQVAGPGSRVDGILPLHHLKEDPTVPIEWRSAEDFFATD